MPTDLGWFEREGFAVGLELSFWYSVEALARLYVSGLTATPYPCEERCQCSLCGWDAAPALVHVHGRRAPVPGSLNSTEDVGPYCHFQAITLKLCTPKEIAYVVERLSTVLDGTAETHQDNESQEAWVLSFQVNVSAERQNRVGILRLLRRYADEFLTLTAATPADLVPFFGAFAMPHRGSLRVLAVHAPNYYRRRFGSGLVRAELLKDDHFGRCLAFKGSDNRAEFRLPATVNRERMFTAVNVCVGLYRAAYLGFTNEQLEAPLFDFVAPYLTSEV